MPGRTEVPLEVALVVLEVAPGVVPEVAAEVAAWYWAWIGGLHDSVLCRDDNSGVVVGLFDLCESLG